MSASREERVLDQLIEECKKQIIWAKQDGAYPFLEDRRMLLIELYEKRTEARKRAAP